MPNTLTENDWKLLLQRIDAGRCMPFLGAGACYGTLPLGGDVARDWAKAYGYPFKDDDDLVRVAQFVAVENDPLFPKEEFLRLLAKFGLPNFKEADEPHAMLADLPLPIYMTSNYDSFMFDALKHRRRDPRREMCRWNDLVKDQPSVFDADPPFAPTVANPVVFHLHGHTVAESLVLTEDDYLRFLVAMAREANTFLPAPVQRALAGSSLLFIGYRLADWNFRVLMQGLRTSAMTRSVMVMLPPGDSDEARQKATKYLDKYYKAMDMQIYWGTAREFCADLRKRWTAFKS